MAEQTPDTAEKGPGRHKGLLMGGILLGVMLLEGGGIFVAMKLFGSKPAPAIGAGLMEPQGQTPADQELLVVQLKAPNVRTGKLYLYDIEVQAVVEQRNKSQAEALLANRKGTIEDRLAKIIRAADPQHLQEPGLETLRRQVKYELEQIAGQEGLIKEVLIPKCTPFRADY
jgi:flagellar basal body-associated protein FliL